MPPESVTFAGTHALTSPWSRACAFAPLTERKPLAAASSADAFVVFETPEMLLPFESAL